MKQKHNGGFSLIETLVAITVLALIVVPTCTSLVMSHRINAKTEEMMQAQLAVSSAVEMLMAEGIQYDIRTGTVTNASEDRFADVEITIENKVGYYAVTVESKVVASVKVTTIIREETYTSTEPTSDSGEEATT